MALCFSYNCFITFIRQKIATWAIHFSFAFEKCSHLFCWISSLSVAWRMDCTTSHDCSCVVSSLVKSYNYRQIQHKWFVLMVSCWVLWQEKYLSNHVWNWKLEWVVKYCSVTAAIFCNKFRVWEWVIGYICKAKQHSKHVSYETWDLIHAFVFHCMLWLVRCSWEGQGSYDTGGWG